MKGQYSGLGRGMQIQPGPKVILSDEEKDRLRHERIGRQLIRAQKDRQARQLAEARTAHMKLNDEEPL